MARATTDGGDKIAIAVFYARILSRMLCYDNDLRIDYHSRVRKKSDSYRSLCAPFRVRSSSFISMNQIMM